MNKFNKVEFISEIGINHDGSFDTAKKLIQQSKEIECDFVKFQVRDIKEVYHPNFLKNPSNSENANQYIYNEIKRSYLDKSKYIQLFKFAKKLDIKIMVTPFDLKSLTLCKRKEVHAIKIGSPDFNNIQLIISAFKLKKPLFLSTGMATDSEINTMKKNLKKFNIYNVPITIFHCVSSYPPNEHEMNLKYIKNLMKKFPDYKIGYSGHERGYLPSLISIFFGAKVIERHITLNNKLKGPDHNSSLIKKEFKKLISNSKKINKKLNNNNINLKKFLKEFNLSGVKNSIGKYVKTLSLNADFNKKILGKSAIYKKNFNKNKIIKVEDLRFVSPGKGLSGLEFYELKKKLTKNVFKNNYLSRSDFEKKENKKFDRGKIKIINKKWGLIGRLGDFEQFIDEKADLIEIHLTWRELINPKIIYENYNTELIIHAPEYFNDKLIDFTSDDKNILNNSFEMIENLNNLVEKIKNNFVYDYQKGPKVVLHPGGHSEKSIHSVSKINQYRNLLKNLKNIKSKNYNLLLENMPPYPWYYGGKFYQHIFTDTKEIKKFCKEANINVCYDTSHAKLASNMLKKNFKNFTKDILQNIEYLHVSDAAKMHQEGLQIGEGEIDFKMFFQLVKNLNVNFVPEIWNGHLDNGQGFKTAMHNIQKIMRKISVKKHC